MQVPELRILLLRVQHPQRPVLVQNTNCTLRRQLEEMRGRLAEAEVLAEAAEARATTAEARAAAIEAELAGSGGGAGGASAGPRPPGAAPMASPPTSERAVGVSPRWVLLLSYVLARVADLERGPGVGQRWRSRRDAHGDTSSRSLTWHLPRLVMPAGGDCTHGTGGPTQPAATAAPDLRVPAAAARTTGRLRRRLRSCLTVWAQRSGGSTGPRW